MTNSAPSAPAYVDVRLFGAFRLFRNGEELRLPPPQAGTVLKVLALRGGVVHTDKLVKAVRPDDDPAVALPRVRNVLSKLRHATGVRVQQRKESIRVLDDLRCDIVEFVLLSGRALAETDVKKRNRLCLQALDLWVGGPLEEDCFESWAQPHRHKALALQRQMWALLPPADRIGVPTPPVPPGKGVLGKGMPGRTR